MPRRLFLAALALPLLLLAVAPVQAGAREDLFEAWRKFLALKSFRATVVGIEPARPASVVEFQAPDRYRIVAPGAPPMLLVGDSAYLDIGGRRMKVPLPIQPLTAQYRDESFLRKLQDGLEIEDLGTDTFAGESVRKFRYVTDAVAPALTPGTAPVAPGGGKATTVAWVSVESALILKLQVHGQVNGADYRTEVRYADFDDPAIVIEPPQ